MLEIYSKRKEYIVLARLTNISLCRDCEKCSLDFLVIYMKVPAVLIEFYAQFIQIIN